MNILHYTIGLPPERRGGSVRYASDLMAEQRRQGHKVYALECGETLWRASRCAIVPDRVHNGVEVSRLSNPLTPSMVYGISRPEPHWRNVRIDFGNVRQYILKRNIGILHLHSLMGIHKDLVDFIKSLGVKVVYTVHDYHGLCASYTRIRPGEDGLCEGPSPERCAVCSENGHSDFFLRLANSGMYRMWRGTALGVGLRSKWEERKSAQKATSGVPSASKIAAFSKLLDYYKSFFGLVDKFHFNNSQSMSFFNSQLGGELDCDVIPVVNRSVYDARKRIDCKVPVRFCYVGGLTPHKGFATLKRAFAKAEIKTGKGKMVLKVYGTGKKGVSGGDESIEYCGSYCSDELPGVMESVDVLVVPSEFAETLGLAVLEALSYGRPVIMSEFVGAKDIVDEYGGGWVYTSEDELSGLLAAIANEPEMVMEKNRGILQSDWRYNLHDHTASILKFYPR